MRVAFLVNDITNIGGVERVVVSLANYFVNRYSYDVTIISIYKPKRDKIGFDIDHNVKIQNLNYDEIWSNAIADLKYNYKIYKEFISKIEVDILFSLYTISNICLSILKNKISFKIIACQHGQYYFDGKKINLIKRILYRNLDNVVLLTKRDEEIYSKFCKKTFVIPNPAPFNSEYCYNYNSKKIIWIGRLSKEKSIEYLIKAFSIIKNTNEWIVEIIGEGPEKEKLIQLVKANNMSEKIIFTPFTKEVKKKYGEAAFTVLTSQSEALPMMLIESKVLGIPSISFDIKTGPKEVIYDGEDGYLIEKNNISELAFYIQKLIENDDLRLDMSKRAFLNAKRFRIENIAEKWIKLIETLN